MLSNSERAARGERALGHYLVDRDTANDDETACTDLVVDLMHMLHIDVPGFDGEGFVHRVLDHYLEELFEAGESCARPLPGGEG